MSVPCSSADNIISRPVPLERQIASGVAKRLGKGLAGCLGTSAAVLFLTGFSYMTTGNGWADLVCWTTAATFAAAAVAAWRGWLWITLLLVASAVTGPVCVEVAIRCIKHLLI